jgi:hypothetical protein
MLKIFSPLNDRVHAIGRRWILTFYCFLITMFSLFGLLISVLIVQIAYADQKIQFSRIDLPGLAIKRL